MKNDEMKCNECNSTDLVIQFEWEGKGTKTAGTKTGVTICQGCGARYGHDTYRFLKGQNEWQLREAVAMLETGLDFIENGDCAEDFSDVPQFQAMIRTMAVLFNDWLTEMKWHLQLEQMDETDVTAFQQYFRNKEMIDDDE